jgi:catalase (peroxidase I)
VLAGQVALEQGGSDPIEFVGGRVDAKDGANVDQLAPRTYYPNPLVAVRDDRKVRGLSREEYVALAGRPRSAVQQERLGCKGKPIAKKISSVSNEFFKVLVSNDWVKAGTDEYQAKGKDMFVKDMDAALMQDPDYKAIVERFAADEALFKKTFSKAWATLMTADKFSIEEGHY